MTKEELEDLMHSAFYRCTDTSTTEDGCLLSYNAYKAACIEVLINVTNDFKKQFENEQSKTNRP